MVWDDIRPIITKPSIIATAIHSIDKLDADKTDSSTSVTQQIARPYPRVARQTVTLNGWTFGPSGNRYWIVHYATCRNAARAATGYSNITSPDGVIISLPCSQVSPAANTPADCLGGQRDIIVVFPGSIQVVNANYGVGDSVIYFIYYTELEMQ